MFTSLSANVGFYPLLAGALVCGRSGNRAHRSHGRVVLGSGELIDRGRGSPQSLHGMTNLNQLLRIFVFLWPTLFFSFSEMTILDSPLSVNLPLSPHTLLVWNT